METITRTATLGMMAGGALLAAGVVLPADYLCGADGQTCNPTAANPLAINSAVALYASASPARDTLITGGSFSTV